MHYTAIIKDGGLFIPNVFSDLNDGQAHVVQVTVDIDDVRQQFSTNAKPKADAPKAPKKQLKKQTKKEVQRVAENTDLNTQRNSALDELEALDDSELSEIFKAYMNDGQESSQISLENL